MWMIPWTLAMLVLSGVPERREGDHPGWPEYYFTISGSATDPWDSSGPPWMGAQPLHVWLSCAYFDGVSRVVMDLQTQNLEITDFVPTAGLQQLGTLPILDLSVPGCPTYLLLGTLTVEDSTGAGGWICVGATRFVEDCGPTPGEHPLGAVGFSSEGTWPCHDEDCSVDFVEPNTWGKVKDKFR